ncbi:acyl-CoA reductase [Pedobacter immunditicola]|uniref:acyl-CoA reductase n=1 Tax=Pedobacter immunditicola TaxID=3133440 RepID=UPI0030A6ED08
MSFLTAEKIIIAFNQLSTFLKHPDEHLRDLVLRAPNHNAWFTSEEVERSLASFHAMLQENDVKKWFEDIKITAQAKKVGLILAGNIPMVGFHDILCVLATGHIALIKLSSSDDKLLPAILAKLIEIEPLFEDQIVYTDRLKDFNAIIATGSNNSSRYFEYYFGKVPNIIRKNRNSVALLTGKESTADIQQLGHDIFDYFGLGCRNVSKIYIPEDYDIKDFFEPLEAFQPIFNHFKYNNNYDYNKSIYLVNAAKHFDNGFLLLKEDKNLASPLAVLYYERYQNLEEVEQELAAAENNIQCVVTSAKLNLKSGVVGFGDSQSPKLWDYADNVDTIAFLNGL